MNPRKAVWPGQAIILVRVSEIFSELVVDERFFQNTILIIYFGSLTCSV